MQILSRPTKERRNASYKILAVASIVLLASCVSSCSVINVYEGSTRVQQRFGLPIFTINTSPLDEAVYIESFGIGVVTSPTGVSLGYARETYLAISKDKCAAVFINPTRDATKELLVTLDTAKVELNNICTFPLQGVQNE